MNLLKGILHPCIFGIKKGSVSFGSERLLFPCVRLSTSGTRQVVMMSMLDILEFLKRESGSETALVLSEAAMCRQRCGQFMKDMQKAALEKYLGPPVKGHHGFKASIASKASEVR